MEQLNEIFKTLLDRTDISFVRYIHDEIDWSSRMFAITGARGVGKTTLLMQHIKLHHQLDDTLYVYADDLYFSENRLYDTASDFYKNGGKHFYIDEIHKYSGWSKELKMMYDHFPGLQIIFTGSSILELYKGSDDLSRRALLYHLPGMSFREYLNMSKGLSLVVSPLEDILENKVEIPGIEHPLPLFKEYLKKGFYPFSHEAEYEQRLRNILNLTLETDIPIYAGMNVSSSKKLKKLLYIIAQNVPFKPNFSKIAEMMGIHRNQVTDFLYYLEKAGIVAQLRNHTGGIRGLGKVEKVYLANTNLIYAIAENKTNMGNLRETFFLSQMSVRQNVVSSAIADFSIGECTFEIGGKNKTSKQIQGVPNAYLVKDTMEFGYRNTIPLWAFGFNY